MDCESTFTFTSRVLLALQAAAIATQLGCGELADDARDLADDQLELGESLELAAERAAPSDQALCCGQRTTLVEGIKAAENLLISSDERLFVTGDDGIFELVRDDEGEFTAVSLVSAADCQFGGITETHGVVYANCYNFADSFLYAAELSEKPIFQRIATFAGILLANGLTADDDGNLYVAATFQSQILRLRFTSDRFAVAENTRWLSPSGLLTNGIEYFDGAIYWSDGTYLNRSQIGTNGRAGRTRTLATRVTFFDDLYVSDRGVLAADYLGNSLRAYDLQGRSIGVSRTSVASPSSVLRAEGRAGFSEHALIVTEKGENRVSLIE